MIRKLLFWLIFPVATLAMDRPKQDHSDEQAIKTLDFIRTGFHEYGTELSKIAKNECRSSFDKDCVAKTGTKIDREIRARVRSSPHRDGIVFEQGINPFGYQGYLDFSWHFPWKKYPELEGVIQIENTLKRRTFVGPTHSWTCTPKQTLDGAIFVRCMQEEKQ